MLRQLLVILTMIAISALLCQGQHIVLPDTVFDAYKSDNISDFTSGKDLIPIQPLTDPLFQEAPAVSLEDYVVAPDRTQSLFYEFPEMPSEFYLHVLVLHLSKVKIPGLEAEMARYNLMLENFSRNLLQGGNYTVPYVPAIVTDTRAATLISSGGGGGVVVSGTLDPFEAYNRWVQERRLMRAKSIIREFESLPVPKEEDLKMSTILLPDNLLQENNYDVKVKQAGDDPPYRPYGQ